MTNTRSRTFLGLPLINGTIPMLQIATLLVASMAHQSPAEMIFRDTFDDGDPFDGSPVEWHPFLRSDQMTVSNDAVVLSNDSGGFARALTEDLSLTDTSIRAQVAAVEGSPITTFGITARAGGGGSYSAFFGNWGVIGISRDPGNFLRTVRTDMNPWREDLVFQLDIIDNEISMWAWRPGENMPEQPLAKARDNTFSKGEVGMFAYDHGRTTSGVFRYFHVADTPIRDLKPGDADQDLDFDQFDLIQVQQAGKYMTGQPATWGEGDWNGPPGGVPGYPLAGDGLFNQFDIVAAQQAANYLSGTHAALGTKGMAVDTLIPVPEPETITLLALGLLGLFGHTIRAPRTKSDHTRNRVRKTHS